MTDYLIYDIEVFSHNNLAVFKNINGETIAKFQSNGQGGVDDNGYNGLDKLLADKTLVGYNNHYYDDRVLPKMIAGWSPEQVKALNDTIIGGDKQIGKDTAFKGTFDCFQQIDVGRPGLKKIEGNLGRTILESDVPFDIDRPLTDAELSDVFHYCEMDVAMTVEVFKMRQSNYFEAKQNLIEMVDHPSKNIQDWNTTTISTNILLNRPLQKWSDIRLGRTDQDGNYLMMKAVPEDVQNLWQHQDKGHVNVSAWGCDVQFGFGGIHGARVGQKVFHDVTLWDVTSMFPNIILKLGVLGTAGNKYRTILEDRVRNKKLNPDLAAAQKIVINSVYGNLRSEYSLLFNENGAKSVNFYSQSAIWQLCNRLEPYVKHVQQNTDGIAFVKKSGVDDGILSSIKSDWEQEMGLNLEEDKFKTLIQKDVNNYVGVHMDGSLKTKGGDVARFKKDAPFKNNSIRIVDIAVVNKVVYGKDVIDTILENLDKPHLFQFIIQAGRTFQGTFDDAGNQYQKINRVFASKHDGLHLYKKRADGGSVKFPNAPDEMWLYNGDIYDDQGNNLIADFESKIDKTYYYKLIENVLERWED